VSELATDGIPRGGDVPGTEDRSTALLPVARRAGHPAPIRTERLVLREPESRNRTALIELFTSPEVGTYIGGLDRVRSSSVHCLRYRSGVPASSWSTSTGR
jgi:hypothetical protein